MCVDLFCFPLGVLRWTILFTKIWNVYQTFPVKNKNPNAIELKFQIVKKMKCYRY